MGLLQAFKHARPLGIPFGGFTEEERWLPPAMDQEGEMEPLEDHQHRPVALEPDAFPLHGFIDGVQRSVLWEVVEAPNGARVPILVAQIAGGILWRTTDRVPRLVFRRSWIVLAAPFRLMGEDPTRIAAAVPDAHTQEEIDADLSLLVKEDTHWLIADTSSGGLSGEGQMLRNLHDEVAVRRRAMGRIALVRQYLELATLIALRASEVDSPDWLSRFRVLKVLDSHAPRDTRVLVDGPLLLTYRRRERLARLLKGAQSREIERVLLAKTVGVVKGQRLRPKDMERILRLPVGQRSRAYDLTREVDIGGFALRDDAEPDEDVYPSRHVVTYVRLRETPASALYGLTRLDLHRSALGVVQADETGPLTAEEITALDRWAGAVYRERRPTLAADRVQPYPVSLLEGVLQARLLPGPVLHRLGK